MTGRSAAAPLDGERNAWRLLHPALAGAQAFNVLRYKHGAHYDSHMVSTGCRAAQVTPAYSRLPITAAHLLHARRHASLPATMPACAQDTFDPREFGEQPSQRMATVLVYLSGERVKGNAPQHPSLPVCRAHVTTAAESPTAQLCGCAGATQRRLLPHARSPHPCACRRGGGRRDGVPARRPPQRRRCGHRLQVVLKRCGTQRTCSPPSCSIG